MKSVLLALAMMVFAGTVAAANKPNFSGEWKMNASKSNYGALSQPGSFTRKIVHAEPAMTIVEEQSGGAGTDSTVTKKITTDGKAVALEVNGAPVTVSGIWEGKTLVVTTELDKVGVAFKDRMSLSADGKVLTSEVVITAKQGGAKLTIVMERQ